MTLQQLLEKYRTLLNSFWPDAQAIAKDAGEDEWLNDWMQANWELIVEGGLSPDSSITLEIYGEGADFYGSSSRIPRPQATPTHAVRARPAPNAIDALSGQPAEFPADGLVVESFVTTRNGWYFEEPPFDHVLFNDNGLDKVLSVKQVEFFLGPPL
jgi:hypothetical protein